MITKGMFTSNSSEWETPQDLFDKLHEEFRLHLDPCATERNHKTCVYYTKKENGLEKDWSWAGGVFMNPPYGRQIGQWIKKAYLESQKGCTVVCLLPARTDTKWFHNYCLPYGKIRFIKGRLKFKGAKNSAPFPSMIVVFGNVL